MRKSRIKCVEEIILELNSYGLKLLNKPNILSVNEKLNLECINGHKVNANLKTIRSNNKLNKCSRCTNLNNFYEIKKTLESEGYIVISKEEDYHDVKSKIEYICPNSHRRSSITNELKIGRRCFECGIKKSADSKRRSVEDVVIMFEKYGYKIISDFNSYNDELDKVNVKCPNNHIYETTIGNFSSGYRCKSCYLENNKGSNANGWRGGITDLRNHTRCLINNWKRESLEKSKYKCFVTGKSGDFHIHHHVNFSNILEEVLNELNLDTRDKINKYTNEELLSIEKLLIQKHYDYGLGIVMLKDIHKLFHSVYGIKNNTMEQVLEFKQDYLNGKYNDILSA